MRERKYIKLRVDMYEDTKFKIIDMKPERDLIHYVWTRITTLAGKVDLEGDLYMSKNIPYTIETLAIEFNRDVNNIKLALDVLIQLEMVEFTKDRVYRVKNFAKHQNIKVKEKGNLKDKEEINDKEAQAVEIVKNEIDDKNERNDKEDIESENKVIQNEIENNFNDDKINLENYYKDMNEINNIMNDNNVDDKQKDIIPILLERKKNKRLNKKNKNVDISEFEEKVNNNEMFRFYYDGEVPLSEGEQIVGNWSF